MDFSYSSSSSSLYGGELSSFLNLTKGSSSAYISASISSGSYNITSQKNIFAKYKWLSVDLAYLRNLVSEGFIVNDYSALNLAKLTGFTPKYDINLSKASSVYAGPLWAPFVICIHVDGNIYYYLFDGCVLNSAGIQGSFDVNLGVINNRVSDALSSVMLASGTPKVIGSDMNISINGVLMNSSYTEGNLEVYYHLCFDPGVFDGSFKASYGEHLRLLSAQSYEELQYNKLIDLEVKHNESIALLNQVKTSIDNLSFDQTPVTEGLIDHKNAISAKLVEVVDSVNNLSFDQTPVVTEVSSSKVDIVAALNEVNSSVSSISLDFVDKTMNYKR